MLTPAAERVTVIIVNYNGREHLEECLRSVGAQDYPAFDVLLVDNASADGSVAFVAEQFPMVRVMALEANVGFAAANNGAVSAVSTRYVALLNPDTRVERDWLSELVTVTQRQGLDACQSLVLLYDQPDRINTSATSVSVLGFAWCRDYQAPRGSLRPTGLLAAFSGAAVLLDREQFVAAGGFDASYFLYHEDVDLAWRLRLRGARIGLAPGSIVYHKYRFRRDHQKFFYLERNRLATLAKNYRGATLALLAPVLVLSELGICAQALLQGWLPAKLRSYGSLLWRAAALRQARRSIQQTRRLGDRAIMAPFEPGIHFVEVRSLSVDRLFNPTMRLYWSVVRRLIRW